MTGFLRHVRRPCRATMNATRPRGRRLAVAAAVGVPADGTTVDLHDCNGTAAQVFIPQSNGSLYNPQSGKCLVRYRLVHHAGDPAPDMGLHRQREPAVDAALTCACGAAAGPAGSQAGQAERRAARMRRMSAVSSSVCRSRIAPRSLRSASEV